MPACTRTVSAVSLSSTMRCMRRRSMTRLPSAGSTPPQTPEPPPNGTTGNPFCVAYWRVSEISSAVAGVTMHSGRAVRVPRMPRRTDTHQVSRLCCARLSSSQRTASLPRRTSKASRWRMTPGSGMCHLRTGALRADESLHIADVLAVARDLGSATLGAPAQAVAHELRDRLGNGEAVVHVPEKHAGAPFEKVF